MFNIALAGVAGFGGAFVVTEIIMHTATARTPWPVSMAGHVAAALFSLCVAVLVAASVADAQLTL